MNLLECQQPPVKACSKDAPDPQLMRGYRCMWRPHLCLGSRLDARWQEAWHCHDNKSCERCSSRASSPHLFSRSDEFGSGVLFSVVGQWLRLQRSQWPVLPAVARSERALLLRTSPPAKVMELTCRYCLCRAAGCGLPLASVDIYILNGQCLRVLRVPATAARAGHAAMRPLVLPSVCAQVP